jgi:hypothetical protein
MAWTRASIPAAAVTSPADFTAFEIGDALVVAVVDERKLPNDADFDTQKTQLKVEAVKGSRF